LKLLVKLVYRLLSTIWNLWNVQEQWTGLRKKSEVEKQ